MESVGVYARISSDPRGAGLGVERQITDCDAMAAARGWRVVDHYVDNDVSAFSGKARPSYRRLLDDVTAGRVSTIVAWHPDRLHRSTRELEDFIDLVERTGATVQTVRSGDYDLATPSGRVMARTLGAFARYESEHKSDRIRRKLAQNAEAGKHHGGSRPYGWQPDRRTLDPHEAGVVRATAQRVLDGASLRTIVGELRAADITTTRGRPWSDVTLRPVLIRPRNAGLRVHHGEVIGKGDWEPILDEDTADAVRRVLTDPSRTTNPGARGRTHLLSGIAVCGVCGAPMRVARGKPYTSRKPPHETTAKGIYRCHNKMQSTGCTSRDLASVDAYVTAIVCERLSRPDAAGVLRPPDAEDATAVARADADRLRRRLDDAASDYADDLISREQMLTISARLRPEIEALDAASVPGPPVVGALADLVAADDVHAKWQQLDVRQRRGVIRLLVTVRIHKTRPGRGFDPASVEVVWKGDVG